ncbi:MAG: DUF4274 domain-containing protein [Bacteroidales bacterium]|nr:DUF4274 domain-containing protein [Bacteroidales bacterium]MCL2132746.1 DUF4274 domain-containing protein [Bacteroidales bacterium]
MDTKIAAFLTYLETASAETRHIVMQNYPNELPLNEVVAYLKDDPTTEKATALLMYWLMHPRFSKQFDPNEAREKELEKFGEVYFDLIEDLECKYAAGFYTVQTIGYDPYYDYSRDSGYFGEKRRVPSIMNVPVYGKTIDTATYDREHGLQKGLTAELFAVINAATVPPPTIPVSESEAAPIVSEEPVSPYVPFEPLLAGQKVEEEKLVTVAEDAEKSEWEKVMEKYKEEWKKEEEYDPYAPDPHTDTQHAPNNSKAGCGAFIAIAAIIMLLMRMCENTN